MLNWLGSANGWIALITLSLLEIVLGVDNIVFVSILSGKLPKGQQARGMKIGLILAIIPRVLLLMAIGWIISLNKPIVVLPIPEPDHELVAKGITNLGITGQDLVFIIGGLFLLYKSVKEIHHKLEGAEEEGPNVSKAGAAFASIMIQIMLVNVVFSLDSVITAVGMVEPNKVGGTAAAITIMVGAVLVSTGIMLAFATPVSKYIEKHPTIKMMALAFLILIGVNLLGEGFHQHIPKGYTYFAMGFAMLVEILNIRMQKSKPVQLREAAFDEPEN